VDTSRRDFLKVILAGGISIPTFSMAESFLLSNKKDPNISEDIITSDALQRSYSDLDEINLGFVFSSLLLEYSEYLYSFMIIVLALLVFSISGIPMIDTLYLGIEEHFKI
jgi:hypothetical protein